MAVKTMKDLLTNELRDIYHAEKQLSRHAEISATPKPM
jgi:ferritin-like metal-binding protein YciE